MEEQEASAGVAQAEDITLLHRRLQVAVCRRHRMEDVICPHHHRHRTEVGDRPEAGWAA